MLNLKYFETHSFVMSFYFIFLFYKYVCLQNLVRRNEQLYGSGDAPSGGVALPFILVKVKIMLHLLQTWISKYFIVSLCFNASFKREHFEPFQRYPSKRDIVGSKWIFQ